ncbi:single-stranded DNA-binding protein [Rhizobium phage RHph_I20]|uniref:Single-stranded DNA-binding protein n=1 Tax=Rhizobium phage RHph_I20 TaxID=2509730 RepID=A0A7S5UYR2_9CAUD|nr:single-stranded DNA-binding protein [Rhizobium phage RHph_I20]
MAENKSKYPKHLTPRGILIWPKLNVPDTKYKADGEYKTSLRIPVEVFVKSGLKKMLDEATERALAEAKADGKDLSPAAKAKVKAKGPSYPYGEAFDKEGNHLEDMVDLKFAIKADGVDPKTGESYSNKPKQFDAKGNPINVTLNIGTEAKISFTVFPWATAALGYGVALRPKAVQVLKLIERGAADASAYGFEEEDGYAYGGDDFGGDDHGEEHGHGADESDEQIPF